jgi:hypothetical protein
MINDWLGPMHDGRVPASIRGRGFQESGIGIVRQVDVRAPKCYVTTWFSTLALLVSHIVDFGNRT